MSYHLQYRKKYLDDHPMNESLQFFFKNLKKNPTVLEIGTCRWKPDVPTHHKDLFPDASEYVMMDSKAGIDVDVVGDIMELSLEYFEYFDAIWCSSVFEHLSNPWTASVEMLESLKPGGVFFIQTHFVFPEHGYPDDYFRFTRKGIEHLFNMHPNFNVELVSCYDFPCQINPKNTEIDFNHSAPAYLNVNLAGIKIK